MPNPTTIAMNDETLILTEDGHETLAEYNKARPNAPLTQ
jgi:hypothetical protein